MSSQPSRCHQGVDIAKFNYDYANEQLQSAKAAVRRADNDLRDAEEATLKARAQLRKWKGEYSEQPENEPIYKRWVESVTSAEETQAEMQFRRNNANRALKEAEEAETKALKELEEARRRARESVYNSAGASVDPSVGEYVRVHVEHVVNQSGGRGLASTVCLLLCSMSSEEIVEETPMDVDSWDDVDKALQQLSSLVNIDEKARDKRNVFTAQESLTTMDRPESVLTLKLEGLDG
ncbi:hypothetical protein HDU76_007261, partial [Blyttiomyces sp. JEL0837]